VSGSFRRSVWGVAGLLACSLLSGGGVAAAAPTSSTTSASTTAPVSTGWTVYHGDGVADGTAAAISKVDTAAPAWTSRSLPGQIYGEPLVSGDRVFVATEDDTVDALSTATGATAWSTHVGTPVPSSDLPCGDITPTVGITGTPVVDPARAEIFVVADELTHGTVAHDLVGLSTATGKVELSQDIDPTGADPKALLQRTGLALDQGRVVFGMGGNYGDCSTYRGRVVSVPEAGGQADVFTVDAARDESQGAVWMGGAAPVVDASGNVWVTAGNGSVYSASHAYDDSDSVLELSPSMALLQYFAPTSWPSDNASDLDVSTAPALLPNGQVIVAGKSRIVYLLNGSSLGGIGKEKASLPDACNDDIDGGIAFVGSTAYLPCLSGITAVSATASPARLHLLWTSSVGGGPPILAGGLVWTVGQDGVLYGLDPTTGAVRRHVSVGTPANHFPTPSVGAGLFLVPTAHSVVAFSASAASPSSPSTSTSSAPTSTVTTVPPAVGTDNTAWIWAVVGGVLVVLLGAAVLTVRTRRKHRTG
jgi:outer membrane protein assembly factor BamB